MKELIVLSGFARAGKDTVGDILVQNHGFTKVAFADKLRESLYALNPRIMAEYEGMGHIQNAVSTVQAVIDEEGWDGYKDTMWHDEIRGLLQRMGTEAGRDTIHPDVWINATLPGLPQKAVITDGRFSNEFNAVLHHGGEVWRVNRAGVVQQSDHPSETEALKYEHFDKTLLNNGTIADLTKTVAKAYASFEESFRQREAAARKAAIRTQGNPNAPQKGDGSITSVNVPKRRG